MSLFYPLLDRSPIFSKENGSKLPILATAFSTFFARIRILLHQAGTFDLTSFLSTSGVRSRHVNHALHDQIFRDCVTNFCAMRHIFFNLMGNGNNLE